MLCASICRRRLRCWNKLRRRLGREKFEGTFRRLYPKCENISIDYAVLEPRSAKGEASIQSSFACLRTLAGTIWGRGLHCTSITSASKRGGRSNIIAGMAVSRWTRRGNYIHAPGKFVAAVGVKDLVIVETDDALLVTTRERAQDVGKIVKYLDEKKLAKLTYRTSSR